MLEVQVGRAEMNDCVIHVDARKKCLKQIRDTSINLNQQVIVNAVLPLQFPANAIIGCRENYEWSLFSTVARCYL